MARYRRARVPGGTYFFTVVLRERGTHLLTDHVLELRAAIAQVRRARHFDLLAAAVMPDHLHCVWTLPEGDADNATRWRHIKTLFSRAVDAPRPAGVPLRKGESGIWQRRFWERLLTSERDVQAHVDYVHFNPVKHGFVARAADWPHSSLHRYIRNGWARPDWGGERTAQRPWTRPNSP